MNNSGAVKVILIVTALNLVITYMMASKLQEAAASVEKPVGAVKKLLGIFGL